MFIKTDDGFVMCASEKDDLKNGAYYNDLKKQKFS